MDVDKKGIADNQVVEKRQYVRIRPSETNPIRIRLALPESDDIDVAGMDISGGGISFLVADGARSLAPDDWLYLDISLPGYGTVHALAVVKYAVHSPDATRIGVQFSQMSEDAHRIVLEYLNACTAFP